MQLMFLVMENKFVIPMSDFPEWAISNQVILSIAPYSMVSVDFLMKPS